MNKLWIDFKILADLSLHLIKPSYTILLSIGTIIGVASLIVILSLFRNYYLSSEKVFMGIHPHILIQKEHMTSAERRSIVKKLKLNFNTITMIQPALYVEKKGIVSEVERNTAFCINTQKGMACKPMDDWSVEIDETKYGYNVMKKIESEFSVKGITVQNGKPVMDIENLIISIMKGHNMSRLHLNYNENNRPIPYAFYIQQDIFNEISGYFLLSFPESNEKVYPFWLNGSIRMGTQKGRIPLIVMSLENAQTCLQYEGFNTIEIKTSDPYTSDQLKKNIEQVLGGGYKVKSWTEEERAAFGFLKTVKWMSYTIIASIILVAAISIFSTLFLTVMENQKKIAILKALGMNNVKIYLVFFVTTLLIGFIGIIGGTIAGYAGSYGFIIFFGDTLRNFGIDDLKTHISTANIVIISATTLFLFLPAALIPARKAVKSDVVKGLQNVKS